MRYKQNMWRVYKHTGKDKDYEVYKEALNAATNEVRKAKRHFEHKLAQNIKSDSKSFYAYVRSKQNVRDKVGPEAPGSGLRPRRSGRVFFFRGTHNVRDDLQLSHFVG